MRWTLQLEHKPKQGVQGEPRPSESRMKATPFEGTKAVGLEL